MSGLAKETLSNLGVSPRTKQVTLFDQDGIKITLELPVKVQIKLNDQEYYTCAPVLHNNTLFPIESAEFIVKLNNVRSTGGAKNEIANVQWWDPINFDGNSSMTFKCHSVKPKDKRTCTPDVPDSSQIRWSSTVSNGDGRQTLNNTLSLVSLICKPADPNSEIDDGPEIIIG